MWLYPDRCRPCRVCQAHVPLFNQWDSGENAAKAVDVTNLTFTHHSTRWVIRFVLVCSTLFAKHAVLSLCVSPLDCISCTVLPSETHCAQRPQGKSRTLLLGVRQQSRVSQSPNLSGLATVPVTTKAGKLISDPIGLLGKARS